MPRAFLAWYELDGLSIPAYQEVRGNPESVYGPVIGMGLGIEPVGKQLEHPIASKLVRRQANIVDDQ